MNANIITYEELFVWRDVCELLCRLHAFDQGKWTDFGVDTADISCFVKDAYSVLSFDARARRQMMWDAWRIQLVRWVSSDRVGKHAGWVLRFRWEYKIDFLEKVVLFDANPYQLNMPWLRSDMPKPWDAVIGGVSNPRMGDMVLGGKGERPKF